MHSLKEEFHVVFENSKNWAEGTLKLIDWLRSYVKISWSTLYLSDSLKLSRGGGSALPGAAKVDQLIPTWMLRKASPYYPKSVATIKRWFAEIVGYFERRTTNGIVEGINNKLKLLKRCGFGFRNFNNFEIRALLFWHFPKNLAH